MLYSLKANNKNLLLGLGILIFTARNVFNSYTMIHKQWDEEQIVVNDNGCGFHEFSPPTVPQLPLWINYTSEEREDFKRVQNCLNNIYVFSKQLNEDRSAPFRSKLYCKMDPPPNIEAVLSQHKRVWFIGDSVLLQTYATIACLAAPNLQRNQLNITGDDMDIIYNHSNGSTLLRYTRYGLRFDQYERVLYEADFPEAIRSSTENDAIVMNAGHHYPHSEGPKLKRAASFIANATTNATIYFVETTDEQWPTSNGMFTKSCRVVCNCEAITDDRIAGNGAMVDHSRFSRNITGDLHLHLEAQQDKELQNFYESSIPHLTASFKNNLSSYPYPYDKVPSYLPATWRNDITNPILKQSAHVKIVPVWRQLVAHGEPHGRRDGDCTHKSLNVLIAISEQLLRTMILPKS